MREFGHFGFKNGSKLNQVIGLCCSSSSITAVKHLFMLQIMVIRPFWTKALSLVF